MWRIIACIAALLVEIEAVTGTQEPPPRLFGLKFYRTFGQGTKSIVVSPYSLCSSLTQTAQLAGGQSAAELLLVLGLSSVPLTDMIAMTDDLNLVLRKDFNKDGISYLDPTVIFANASEIIFLKSVSQVGPHQSLQEILHGDTVITPNTVHRYIAQRTDSNIHIQVPPDTLGANILLVVNAMVIHAEWEEFFYRHKTYRHRFIGLVPDGLPDRRVEMMSDVRIVQWKRDYKLQVDVVEVPLRGRDLVFLIVLPLHTQGLSDVEKAILENADALICLCQDLAPTLVRLGIPKFRVQTSLYMKAGLGSMGVVQAFDPDRADFSHLSASTKFYISNIIHAAAIDVNEEGISPLSVPPLQFGSPSGVVPPEQSFIADHPFLFFIKHKSLDQVLTIGKYVGP